MRERLELPPATAAQEMLATDFLYEHQDVLDSIAGDTSKLLARMVLATSSEPLTIKDLNTRTLALHGNVSQPAFAKEQTARDYVKEWVLNLDMATASPRTGARGGRYYEYTTTEKGVASAALLGVVADWQLSHDDMPLRMLLGERTADAPTKEPYANFPTANLRLLQLATVGPVRRAAIEAALPARDSMITYVNIRTLLRDGILRQRRVSGTHILEYSLNPPAAPYVTDLLRDIYALSDGSFADAAIRTAHTSSSDERIARKLCRLRPKWHGSTTSVKATQVPPLAPVMTLRDLNRREFLPDHQATIDASSHSGSKLLFHMMLATAEKPRSILQILARCNELQGENPPHLFTKAAAEVYQNNIRKLLVPSGLVTFTEGSGAGRGRTPSTYEVTPAGRECLPVLGVLALWQINYDIPLSTIVGHPSNSKPTPRNSVDDYEYAHHTTRRLRAMQLAVARPAFTVPDLMNYMTRPHGHDVVTRLEKDSVLRCINTERPAKYAIERRLSGPITELLLSLCSLDDDAYRRQAGRAACRIVGSSVLARALVRPIV